MRIKILGGGWYGCHLAMALKDEHDVLLLERNAELFRGASGANPARLHIGPHYPRSRATRMACQTHSIAFLERYSAMTQPIRSNIYAIAQDDSLVDFGNYAQTLRAEIDLLRVFQPTELGLRGVEGAVLVNERHIVIDRARAFFTRALEPVLNCNAPRGADESQADLTIDCTFCENDASGVDRYEPCITLLLEGPTDTAVTIMDGPFPSLYPWNEDEKLCSLTSALHTPISREPTWILAKQVLDAVRHDHNRVARIADKMILQMAQYFPQVLETHRYRRSLFGIRAMPRSGASARLVHVARVARDHLRIRAGKIDAIFEAEHQVRAHIAGMAG